MAGLEVVELIDRHHVDGAHALDLRAGGRRPSRRASSCARPAAPASLGTAARAAALVLDLGGLGRVVHRLRAGEQRPRRSSSATSAATSSSVAWTDSKHDEARCVRSASAVARVDVELRGFAADGFERAARLPDAPFLFLEAGAKRLRRLVGDAGRARGARRTRARLSSSLASEAAIVSSSSTRRACVRCEIVPARRRRASRARAPLPRAAGPRAPSAPARSTSAACAALASAVRRACACIASRASNSRRCAAFS